MIQGASSNGVARLFNASGKRVITVMVANGRVIVAFSRYDAAGSELAVFFPYDAIAIPLGKVSRIDEKAFFDRFKVAAVF